MTSNGVRVSYLPIEYFFDFGNKSRRGNTAQVGQHAAGEGGRMYNVHSDKILSLSAS